MTSFTRTDRARRPGGIAGGKPGPASFDASYTVHWSQVGVCPYLAQHVLPYGTGMKGDLTVDLAGVIHHAVLTDDSPVECQNGSLSVFWMRNAIAFMAVAQQYTINPRRRRTSSIFIRFSQ